ncbi:MAG: hypothetical protein ACQEP5_00550 [Actinomycetota bacterium]
MSKAAMIFQKSNFSKAVILMLMLGLILAVVSCSRADGQDAGFYPPPHNLQITGISGSNAEKEINLAWEAPESEYAVIQYVVYMNGEEIGRTADTNYKYNIGDNNYAFYVTAVYDGDIESSQSNTVNTESYADLPPVGPGMDERKENGEDIGLDGDQKDNGSQSSEWDAAASDLCGNPYYPVAEGVSHTYATDAGTMTSTITEVGEEGFTVTWDMPGSTQRHEWICLAEGLVDLSHPGGDALNVIGNGVTITGSSDVAGVTIPSSISVGDTWTQTYSGELAVEEYDGQLDYTVIVNYNAVSEEEVTVSAGTFKAIRMDTVLESDYVLKTHGITMPLYTHSMTSSAWLAEGVGSVKSTSNHIIEGTEAVKGLLEEITGTMELVEYSLP